MNDIEIINNLEIFLSKSSGKNISLAKTTKIGNPLQFTGCMLDEQERIITLCILNYGLNLENIDINCLCYFLKQLTNLKALRLANFKIKNLESISEISKLEILALDENEISDFSILSKIYQLKELSLSNNLITDLKPVLLFKKLENIWLNSNQIKILSEDILEINLNIIWKNNILKDGIFLEGNPIENVPIEIIEQGKEAIKQFFNEEKTILNNEKIEKIQIKNFKVIDEIELKLSKKITIILGNNGFGKTSILQALAFAILQDNAQDIKPLNFEPFISIGQKTSEFKVFWNKDLFRNCNLYSTSKNTQTGSCGSNLILLTYGVNIFTRYNEMNYTEMINKIIAGNEKLHNTASLFLEKDDRFYDPLYMFNLFELIEFQDEKNREQIRQIKIILLEKLNFLLPKEIQIKKEKTLYHFFQNNNKLTLQHLSEGYRSAVLLLTDILIRIMSMRNRLQKYDSEINELTIFDRAFGILAIDEFDRHLHPTWQLEYLSKLRKVLPKMQFVMTTHNPLSILDREEDEVLQFFMDEDTKKLGIKTYNGGTKQMDVVMVLLKYFEVNYVVSQSYRKKIDRFYFLSSKKQKNDTQINELKLLQEELKNSMLNELEIPDYKYHKFIEFIHENNINLRNLENTNKLDFKSELWKSLTEKIK